MPARSLPLLRGLGWLAVALLVAVSGAGLVVAIDHPATGTGRPELTARGDRSFAAARPPVREALGTLAAATEGLARAGREAAAALRARDAVAARTRIAEGESALTTATTAAGDLAAVRDDLLRAVGGARLGVANRERLETIQAAIEAAARLPEAWSGVAAGATTAALLTDPLAAHDQHVLEAAAAAREERYSEALEALVRAEDRLQIARLQRDRLPATLDHPTLDEWLVRSADYSAALESLYSVLEASGGEFTAEAEEALAVVEQAQAALPADGGAWVVIVTEIAEPVMTQGLIGIERARGVLTEASSALD